MNGLTKIKPPLHDMQPVKIIVHSHDADKTPFDCHTFLSSIQVPFASYSVNKHIGEPKLKVKTKLKLKIVQNAEPNINLNAPIQNETIVINLPPKREKKREEEKREGEEGKEEEGKEEKREGEEGKEDESKGKRRLLKGVAHIAPGEYKIERLSQRFPKKKPEDAIVTVSSYYMNNRELFVNFMRALFKPYELEMKQTDKPKITCETMKKTANTPFSLLSHQKIVRDYLNLYTPYRGCLLYHGLGSGKTCTSVAVAEGMKSVKRIIIMTPASLQPNYREQLKECGDPMYKRNQYWEWISIVDKPDTLDTLSTVLDLPREFIVGLGGAFLINATKESNYTALTPDQQKTLEVQLDSMIQQKYTFINYNGLRQPKLSEMTNGFTRNIFDDAVIIIDEAHNLVSRIVNKLRAEPKIRGKKTDEEKGEEGKAEGEGEDESIFGNETPLAMSVKIYQMLLRAKNARIIMLSGTPVINYPNEFAILYNIIRGYIPTWKFKLHTRTQTKIDTAWFRLKLKDEMMHDYLDYSPGSETLTVTQNPFGFSNKRTAVKYQGVYYNENNRVSNEQFEKQMKQKLADLGVTVVHTDKTNYKALPDTLDAFVDMFMDPVSHKLKNTPILLRRILGLSSYFKSAEESLLPRYTKTLGTDYHILRIPMSDAQFEQYETIRVDERKKEKNAKTKTAVAVNKDTFEDKPTTYRIFSRLACNFFIPDRPIPDMKKAAAKFDEEGEAEPEGDAVMEADAGNDYAERLNLAMANIREHPDQFLTESALRTYSPKFLSILNNIQEHPGLHLIYSQFRTAEGIGLLSSVLDANGFAQFVIKKSAPNKWTIITQDTDIGKPMYVLYTGTESAEEKEIVRRIYNGEWEKVPSNIADELTKRAPNNRMGEIIKVFMITSSGSEGINLLNTRWVHIVDPYWHPVRTEQVIGRARRICSHADLPEELRTVNVFVYLMVFSESQLKSDTAISLKQNDLSKGVPHVPITSDQYLFEISEIKAGINAQFTEIIQESAFDCFVYGDKCFQFSEPGDDTFSYVPDIAMQPMEKQRAQKAIRP